MVFHMTPQPCEASRRSASIILDWWEPTLHFDQREHSARAREGLGPCRYIAAARLLSLILLTPRIAGILRCYRPRWPSSKYGLSVHPREAAPSSRPAPLMCRCRWGGRGGTAPRQPLPGTHEAWPQRVGWLSHRNWPPAVASITPGIPGREGGASSRLSVADRPWSTQPRYPIRRPARYAQHSPQPALTEFSFSG